MAPPIVQNMYKIVIFLINVNIQVFSTTYFGKIHKLRYIKPYKS